MAGDSACEGIAAKAVVQFLWEPLHACVRGFCVVGHQVMLQVVYGCIAAVPDVTSNTGRVACYTFFTSLEILLST